MKVLDDFREQLYGILDKRATLDAPITSKKISVMYEEVMSVRHPRGFHAARSSTEIFNVHCVKITCQSSRKGLFCLLQTIQLTSSSCPDAKYDYSLISPVVMTSMTVD